MWNRQLVGGMVLAGILGGITIDLMGQPVVFIKEVQAYEEPAPREVMIEVMIDWSEDRIAEEIDKVFPEAPIMHRIMRCESHGQIDAFNPTNNSNDKGLFQISDLYHGKRVRALGLDMGNPIDNIAYARILYDESGLNPWSASRKCWQ